MAARDQWIERVKPTSDEARGADGRETDLCAIPFPLALHCVGSVLAVKGTLRALDGLRADPKDALLTRKKKGGGGTGRKGTFRSYRTPSRSRGALSPAGP